MANFKICVRKQRRDGYWAVYIRVQNNKSVAYIKTDKAVASSALKKDEVKDPYVIRFLSERITRYVEQLNKIEDTSGWKANEIVEYLKQGDEEVCFSDYARTYHDRMYGRGERRNARNYEMAYQHLERYAGTNRLMFSMLTSTFVNDWIRTLGHTHRAKEMYPVCVRQIFKEAVKEFNDYDRGVIRIKTNPWLKVQIPKADKAAFAASIGLPPTGLSNYLGKQRRSKPNIEMVTNIVVNLHVDPMWLLTGKESSKNEVHTQGDYSPASVNGNVSVSSDNAVLQERVSLLEKLLEEKERTIKILMER